jgi:hypothetical protein
VIKNNKNRKMNIKSKLIKVLPLQSGTGKNGEWKKQDIIVETEGQYPKKICISIWGDKIDDAVLQEGNLLDISFDIESREYNGKWYTNIKAWKIILVSGNTTGETIKEIETDTDLPGFDELDKDLPF